MTAFSMPTLESYNSNGEFLRFRCNPCSLGVV